MMRLTVMWNVDSTIDPDGRSPVAERIVERWRHDSGTVRFFRSSANFLYTVQIDGTPHFLRFADGQERRRQAIEADIDLLVGLRQTGIDVPLPVASSHGNLVETVETRWGTFHAVVFPALEGTQPEIEDLDDAGLQRWGAALGALHAALATYPAGKAASRPTWRHHLDMIQATVPEGSPALHSELTEVARELASLPQDPATFGLIHFDFELDNLVWQDDAIGILDLDDCSHLWYAADIVFALRDLFEEWAGPGDTRFRAFIRGYSEHRPMVGDQISHLPLFQRLDDLLRYARIVHAADLDVGPEHPEWLGTLSGKLHDRAAAYRASIENRAS